MAPRIRITASDTIVESDEAADAAIAADFSRRHGLVLDDLLAPDVMTMINSALARATFVQNDVARVGSRTLEQPRLCGDMLCFVLKRPALHAWLTKVTASEPIASVIGSVARLQAGQGHQLSWHNDAAARRVLGVTVNLGVEPYEGGLFELRERGSDEVLLRHDHKKPGTALVFSVAKGLLHRVKPLTAGGPRTVFSGWFLSATEKPG